MNTIEERYNIASVMANKKATDVKLAIGKDLHEQKAATLKNHSDILSSLLRAMFTDLLTLPATGQLLRKNYPGQSIFKNNTCFVKSHFHERRQIRKYPQVFQFLEERKTDMKEQN